MFKIWRKKWIRKQRTMKRSLRNSHVHSILGKRAFHPHLWKSDKRSIAGGLAVGLAIAFTPTIPFQMLLAAAGAIFFRVNLPIAMAACWVTNPFTAIPVFVAARDLGKFMLTHNESVNAFITLFTPAGHTGKFIRESLFLTSGSLIFSALASSAGYLGVLALWKIATHNKPPQPPATAKPNQKTPAA